MRQDQRTDGRNEYRDDRELWAAEQHPLVPPQAHQRPPRRVSTSWIVGVVAAVVLAVGVAWTQMVDAPVLGTPGKRWDVQIASASKQSTTALMFGRRAGLHLITVTARPEGGEARDVLPATLKDGDVWLVSLGGPALDIRTKAPAGEPPMEFRAQSHVINLYQGAKGTGVRTW